MKKLKPTQEKCLLQVLMHSRTQEEPLEGTPGSLKGKGEQAGRWPLRFDVKGKMAENESGAELCQLCV